MDVTPGIFYRRHIKKFDHFQMRALRSILGIKWQVKVSNLEALERNDCSSIETILLKAQMGWVGHVIRMDEYRMSRRLLCGELVCGRRNQERPKKRYKDTVKAKRTWAACRRLHILASNNSLGVHQFRRGPMPEAHLCKRKAAQSFNHRHPD